MSYMVQNRIADSIPGGKSRTQLAQEVGISRVHLQRIIAGRQLPSIEIALKISVV
ncbi:MAG: helix-turn-helix transcriptional regulator, partial [Acidobacteria bacterium]|nr:helix-turn-helix transcriptional regulator [Acidobacteriota bacterium]